MIPFLNLKVGNQQIKKELVQSFENFIDSGWYILGDAVKQFENEYSAYNQVAHCIGVSNGLDALHLSLKVLGIGAGDEVIVPSNTYIATALAVSYLDATPVFVEPNPATYNIDPAQIEAAITNKTKAIMPVHLYGQACEMDRIMAIADKRRLFVVEDNAQAQGATCNGQLTGNFGHVNGTSFYPGKNLGALGDAGAITTNNAELAKKLLAFRNYGSERKYYNEVIGHNMRLDECQAGFLSIKLKYLPTWTSQRIQIAQWYNEALFDISQLTLPITAINCSHVYHLYVVRTKRRNELQEHLQKNGIGTLIHYPIPPHLQEAYKYLNYHKGNFPIAEEIADTCISLPLWPGMEQAMVKEIAAVIKAFFS